MKRQGDCHEWASELSNSKMKARYKTGHSQDGAQAIEADDLASRWSSGCKVLFCFAFNWSILRDFLGGSVEKNLLTMQGWEDPWVGKILWRRKWQPTPVFLPGKSHGQRILAGYSPWGHKRVRYNFTAKSQPYSWFTVYKCTAKWFSYINFFKFLLNWGTVNLPDHVSFRYTA